jgi:hypothetical protein
MAQVHGTWGNLERSRRRITRRDHVREVSRAHPAFTGSHKSQGSPGEAGRRIRMGALPLTEENINHDTGANSGQGVRAPDDIVVRWEEIVEPRLVLNKVMYP